MEVPRGTVTRMHAPFATVASHASRPLSDGYTRPCLCNGSPCSPAADTWQLPRSALVRAKSYIELPRLR